MHRFLFVITLVFVSCFGSLQGQEVWPGDVNNNGTVNNVDLLYWGIANGTAGFPRDEEGTDWTNYQIDEPWGQTFANGLDYAYADCDGNGFVEEEDVEDAIEENFGLFHSPPTTDGYLNGTVGTNPQLRLQSSENIVGEGATVLIDLDIDLAGQAFDFYGVALQLSYSTGFIEDDEGPEFSLESGSWIEGDGSTARSYYHDFEGNGEASLGITRTNQLTVPVQNGKVGTFSVVIEDIIVGLTIDTFVLQIDSVLFLGNGYSTLAVAPDTVEIIVAKDPNDVPSTGGGNGNGGGSGNQGGGGKPTNTNNIALENQGLGASAAVEVFPNPVHKGPFLVRTDVPIVRSSLVDALGRTLPVDPSMQKQGEYYFDQLSPAPGWYWLRLELASGDIAYEPIYFTN